MRHREGDTNNVEDEVDKRRLMRFNPELTTGTIIEILVILIGIALGWAKLDAGQLLTNQRIDTIERRSTDQELRTSATLAEMKADGKDNGQRIDQTSQKVSDLKTKIDLLDLKMSQVRK